ncbi:transketolase family protein [Paucibacter sp. Y2R2-4]|uniref:transketolase family protein n=1 Tax=Paucibacter sp. Y2R2-4 TaxID=2893553 RepID=UPI0021E446F7|nr:transketolase [Paucibacter sp. Y2R2-4]MCV2348161.1 transketolase [Paucibacter sp. Y2R2-4]
MRNAFIQELVTLARAHPHIALVVGDLGYSVIEPFADEFPDRFINAGVAEQNMTGLAAGMASEGYHVFTYSIANFPTFRCAEQIRNDVDYHRLPVTVVSVGGGLAYGALGYSHHAVQDYALIRSFPNMLIAAPGDPMEVRACLRYLVANPGPSYLRLGKAGEPCFHTEPPALEPGRWLPVRPGSGPKAVLTTGAGLGIAMGWPGDWTHQPVYSMPLWSLASKRAQAAQLSSFERVLTVEDHLLDGGFGSWLLEARAMVQGTQVQVMPLALSAEVCGTVGSQAMLNALGGLDQPPRSFL